MEIVSANSKDADTLADLRALAMKESLEALGIFDPTRVREGLLSSFDPTLTKKVLINGQLAAFYVLREEPDWLYLNHLYVLPQFQGEKIGTTVLSLIIKQGDELGKKIKLRALKESRSNDFYLSHGFVKTHEEEFDNYYTRERGDNMKTIGLLGGMSWQSTAGYYRAINEGVKKSLGGLHSAKIAMVSVDFAEIEVMQSNGDWEGSGKLLAEAALRVQAAGADFLLICTNTMHKVAPQIEEAIDFALLHIADATGEVLVNKGVETVGLLGTAFTMEQDFYKGRLKERYGLNVIIPNEKDVQIIHDIIFQELCLGDIREESKQEYLRIIEALAAQGAQGVILGCTEIGMLVSQSDTKVSLFDTTQIHADSAVKLAISPQLLSQH